MLAVLVSCEKQDILGDQGKKTDKDVPYVLLSSIPDKRVADTAYVRTRFWSINDDVKNLTIEQKGYKKRDISLKWNITYKKDEEDVSRDFEYASDFDTTFFGPNIFLNLDNTGNSFDTLYRTIENTYVFNGKWVVPEDYSVVSEKDGDVFSAISDETLTDIKGQLIGNMNTWDVLKIYPEADTSFFVLDDQNSFTGIISTEGKTKLTDVLNVELLKSFLKSGKLKEVAGVDFKAKVTNSDGVIREDESSFEILN